MELAEQKEVYTDQVSLDLIRKHAAGGKDAVPVSMTCTRPLYRIFKK